MGAAFTAFKHLNYKQVNGLIVVVELKVDQHKSRTSETYSFSNTS